MALDPTSFREVMSQFTTGITVVTTCTDEQVHGLTVNAFCSVSLEPPLILVCINSSGYFHELVIRSGVFAVNILSDRHEHLSRRFAVPELAPSDRFESVCYRTEATGAPVLNDAFGWLDCRLTKTFPAGDHTVCIGEIIALGRTNGVKPLVFFQSRYHRGDMSSMNNGS
jgi:flavin reductase (DIM6/NTAB) family NADH-FMN oxidoreductase RutF